MTMITPSYLGETIEYSSLHACRSTLEDPTAKDPAARFSSAHAMRLAIEEAMPAAWQTNCDKQSEAFLRTLFKDRIAERGRALQAALEAADRGSRPKPSEIHAPFPRSHSTMRAVSVETVDVLHAPGDGRPGEAVADADAALGVGKARGARWRTGGAIAAMTLMAFAAGGLGLRGRLATTVGSDPPRVYGAPGALPSSETIPVAPTPTASETTTALPPAPTDSGDSPSASSAVPHAGAPRRRREQATTRADAPGAASTPPPPPSTRPASSPEGTPSIDPLSRRK